MKIFKAEQWNIEVLAPLFEAYRLANGMSENPDRTFNLSNKSYAFLMKACFLLL